MDLAGPVGFSLFRSDNYEFYLGQGYKTHQTGGNFYMDWIKQFTVSGSYSVGTGINYAPSSGQPYVGRAQNASFGFSWRPDSRTRIESFYYYSQLLGPRAPGGQAPTAYVNHLERFKINYQLTKELSFRVIFDYNFISSNADLFDVGRFKSIVPDLLVTYLLNYGTVRRLQSEH
jgi:hypothetical protein